MVRYSLSSAASKDLIGIYKYGKKQFGNNQAKLYLSNLELFLNDLALGQELARDASMFAHNLKYYIYSAHVIFYLIDSNKSIYIIRILGSRMNFIEHL